eukprot:5957102-Pyramimonas_sp.AAC.1
MKTISRTGAFPLRRGARCRVGPPGALWGSPRRSRGRHRPSWSLWGPLRSLSRGLKNDDCFTDGSLSVEKESA